MNMITHRYENFYQQNLYNFKKQERLRTVIFHKPERNNGSLFNSDIFSKNAEFPKSKENSAFWHPEEDLNLRPIA